MPKKLTYAESGVDRELRMETKETLQLLKQTYRFNVYGRVLQLPYGNVFPVGDRYLDTVIEGVGTKVLLAQLANKYDTIGVDGVAVAVNDVIRSGANPLAIVDNIHTQKSDPNITEMLMKGLVRGAVESSCVVAGGEIGDVAPIIRGLRKDNGFDLVVACVGEVTKDQIIFGDEIKPGDDVIGIRSSGIHSNGVSLARRVLFEEWGGKFDAFDVPDGLNRELVYEVLEPTRIYVKPLQKVLKEHEVKGAVHITGDAYLKFGRLMTFSKGIGFKFDNFKPQPVFELVQKTAESYGGITNLEMLKTFNLGWGFAIVVDSGVRDDVLEILEKDEAAAEVIGQVTSGNQIHAVYKGEKLLVR